MSLELDRNQALDLWRGVMVTSVRSREDHDLTARQLAVLMTVHLAPGPHTVRGLAETLHVGKPAISRALDTLTEKGLARRKKDENDGRNVFIQATPKGAGFLQAFGDRISLSARGLETPAQYRFER